MNIQRLLSLITGAMFLSALTQTALAWESENKQLAEIENELADGSAYLSQASVRENRAKGKLLCNTINGEVRLFTFTGKEFSLPSNGIMRPLSLKHQQIRSSVAFFNSKGDMTAYAGPFATSDESTLHVLKTRAEAHCYGQKDRLLTMAHHI